MVKRMRDERGSATLVEMCFIFPIVIIVVLTMLYIGLFFLQSAVANSYAQRAVVYVSRMVTMPAYDMLGEFSSSVDFSSNPTTAQVNKAVSKHKPYRFCSSDVVDTDKVDTVARTLENLLVDAGFLFGDVSCEIETENLFIYQTVTVNVTQSISLPFFVQFLGLPASIDLMTSVQAGATCPAEFVRNVDLVYDVADVFTGGNLSAFMEKFNSIKSKFVL